MDDLSKDTKNSQISICLVSFDELLSPGPCTLSYFAQNFTFRKVS